MIKPAEMLIVEAPEDCGNAPRKRIIRDLIVALYGGEVSKALSYLSENVNWQMIGSWGASDKAEVGHHLSQQSRVVHLRIGTIITHGTDCGIDGEITFEDGRQAAFCHVLIFTGGAKSATIKTVRSYQIARAN
ncbi:nuclear transport factor 2 family protein [Pelagibacterium sediminicola]|uniref:nuclear transport factor 2 family protein n=1 Tax=Pelagibacterium sediminicola TaxID=2248761 RepID=UPI000E313662|nr:nuclear transport factor 2 family protein [Pelagibacterium sediminicola]